MARPRITLDTGAYTRTHRHAPYADTKEMWAVTLDAEEKVIVRYGLYKDMVRWAKAQAQRSVKVLP